jgi:transcriptional regulator
MYVPGHFAMDEAAVAELLRHHGAADLVTVTPSGLMATMLPFIYVPLEDDADARGARGVSAHRARGVSARGARGGSARGALGGSARGARGGSESQHGGAPHWGALHGHLARNNDQWRAGSAGEALVIVRGPNAYISPGWYASKVEHGRVVPTWNYVTAHVYGELVVHDDPVWTEDLVRRLTAKHEAYRERPWSVDDAPRPFIEGQLRAIVGVELLITRVEAKAKLSQNRPAADVDGVIAGLRDRGDAASADAAEQARS